MIPFTFYGDLLGISAAYKLGTNIAKVKLNNFYSETFNTLRSYCNKKPTDTVLMFSDSLFIYGDDALFALDYIPLVFNNLLSHDLLLRGAMVKGKLAFEPRFTIANFDKGLPTDDVLARANGLEKLYKGARFIIESNLASDLFTEYPQWATNEGYQRTFMNQVINGHILSHICPTPDQNNYEFLYPWTGADENIDYEEKQKNLKNIESMLSEDLRKHYTETIALLNRCKIRKRISLGG